MSDDSRVHFARSASRGLEFTSKNPMGGSPIFRQPRAAVKFALKGINGGTVGKAFFALHCDIRTAVDHQETGQ